MTTNESENCADLGNTKRFGIEEIKQISDKQIDICQIRNQKTKNVSVQLKNSAMQSIRKSICDSRKNPLPIEQLFS